MKVIIINGPNLNLLGKREESMYGNISFEKHFIELKNNFTRLELEYYQSNIEGEIINKLHEIGFSYDCILLNAGGYTHTSVAITDAIASISTDVIEVHMTNIFSREEFRKKSLLSVNCKSVICGFGLESYNLALESLKL
jgi:3-dehydroquinate dehydratase-2